jgi:uncharacterized protein VirK/YbjX
MSRRKEADFSVLADTWKNNDRLQHRKTVTGPPAFPYLAARISRKKKTTTLRENSGHVSTHLNIHGNVIAFRAHVGNYNVVRPPAKLLSDYLNIEVMRVIP